VTTAVFLAKSTLTALTPETFSSDFFTVIGQTAQVMFFTSSVTVLGAAANAVHDEATRAEDTDWPQILALYELLMRMSDNPIVTMNHAIAVAMVHGPAKGLDLLEALSSDSRLAHQHRVDATLAHLLELAGDRASAILHYREAAGKTANLAERNYLLAQAARLHAIDGDGIHGGEE
jgi:predicted RNA polymerase sigma factor